MADHKLFRWSDLVGVCLLITGLFVALQSFVIAGLFLMVTGVLFSASIHQRDKPENE